MKTYKIKINYEKEIEAKNMQKAIEKFWDSIEDVEILLNENTTIKEVKKNNEICYECGKSVKFGSGRFVNRVPSFDDIEERKSMNVPFPKGEFICEECDLKENKNV